MRLILAMLATLTANTGLGATYDYLISDYPTAVGTADDCRALARTLGDRLVAISDATSAVGICTNVTDSHYDMVLRYESEERLEFISTVDAGQTLTQPGFYASRQACEAALPGEVETFQAATGLEPLYTPVCMDLGGFNNRTPWMFRIEAVGSAEKVPLLEQADIFGTPAGFTMPAFLEATTEGIKDLGVDVRLSKYESTVGLSHLVYFLYADSNVFLSTETFATLPDSATCDAELGRLKESLFETNNIISYCSTEFPRTTYDVSGLFLNAVPYAVVPSLETFESYSACTRGRLNAINAAVADGMVVEDGLCSLAAVGRWKVMLLTVARD